jgi:four helix bundle protein
MRVERFEDLLAWQHGRNLCRDVYLLTMRNPFVRDFALRDQIRKSAISIPSNVAEGFERFRPGEFHQFLSIAKGSAGELRTQLYIASDIGYIDDPTRVEMLNRAEETARIIGALRRSIESRKNSALSTQHSAL